MVDSLTDYALNEQLPSWGVLVLESHHSPRFTMEWRTHEFIKVVFVLNGEGKFIFADQSTPFTAADVVVVPANTANRIEDKPGSAASLYVCCLDRRLFQFDPSLVDRFKRETIRGDGHFANRVASLMRRMVYCQQRGGPDVGLSLVTDALQLTQRIMPPRWDTQAAGRPAIGLPKVGSACSSSEQTMMANYIESLATDFFETTTIDDAAERLGMSRRTFTKRFAQMTGQSWLSYVRTLAIDHAQIRLRKSSLPIASVAFECGFNDLSTFYRQFKRQVGISPAAFRHQHNEGWSDD